MKAGEELGKLVLLVVVDVYKDLLVFRSLFFLELSLLELCLQPLSQQFISTMSLSCLLVLNEEVCEACHVS